MAETATVRRRHVRFEAMWDALAPVGRDATTGGYRRFAWNDADMLCREWFAGEAAARSMPVLEDGNGNLFAWWGDPGDGDAVLTGSHLDSVPDGGAFDGPLGIVSAFAAIDQLRSQSVRPQRPLGIACFVEEEGSRFGIACAGSRLLTGALAADAAVARRDRDGLTLAEVMRRRGRDPERTGADLDLQGRVGCFVELHIEQGRALVHSGAPVGVASAIWPHGRWRFDFTGRADHAGTTAMSDRCDPMLTYAMTALAANKQARVADARATFGRVEVSPNATNAIPSQIRGWLDARAPDDERVAALVDVVSRQAAERARRDGTSLAIEAESVTSRVDFDATLRDRLADLLGKVPVLATGAGHDAGVLQAYGIPSAMVFVRNPTGVSHAPREHAEMTDCLAGVTALATVLEELVSR